jgi:KDO2-lipid IV(A) lauroyltransferase
MNLRVRYKGRDVRFRFSYLVQYVFLHVLFAVLKCVPFRILIRSATPIGRFLFRSFRKHAGIAMDNLKTAFPEKTTDEIADLGREVFIGLVRIALEFVHIRRLSRMEFIRSNVRLVNHETLHEALKEGRGVVIITSHLGNWELEGAVTCTLGLPLNAIYFQQSNFLADSFFNRIRTRTGMRLIMKRNAVRETLQALGRNEMVAFLSDQDAGDSGVFVPFFGRSASTVKGPVYFGLKTGAPVILTHFIRTGTDSYDFIMERVPMKTTGDFEADVRTNTQIWSGMLENVIRKYPEQWFWVHKRWKTKEKMS